MKILNLYAGIGGNRKLWGNDHKITAVECNQEIGRIYRDNFPNDELIIGDAHSFLEENYMNYDFIWASPPCPTHSRTRFMQVKKIYIDMTLWQEIQFLMSWHKGYFVVENVIPYYKPFILPTSELHRHYLWANFKIENKEFEKLETCKKLKEKDFLQEKFGYDLTNYSGIDKRKVLRNCVVPDMGLHIFNEMLRAKSTSDNSSYADNASAQTCFAGFA